MKITIEIPDDCYGESFDEDDNLIISEPPAGDKAKREKLLDRSFCVLRPQKSAPHRRALC